MTTGHSQDFLNLGDNNTIKILVVEDSPSRLFDCNTFWKKRVRSSSLS